MIYSSLLPGHVPCESSAIVRARTCTPCSTSFADANSSGRWLMPSLQGMKIMLVGAILEVAPNECETRDEETEDECPTLMRGKTLRFEYLSVKIYGLDSISGRYNHP